MVGTFFNLCGIAVFLTLCWHWCNALIKQLSQLVIWLVYERLVLHRFDFLLIDILNRLNFVWIDAFQVTAPAHLVLLVNCVEQVLLLRDILVHEDTMGASCSLTRPLSALFIVAAAGPLNLWLINRLTEETIHVAFSNSHFLRTIVHLVV